MDAGAWIALLTFVFTVLCGLVTLTWIVARIVSKIWDAIRLLKWRVKRLEEGAGIKGEDDDTIPMEESA